jgi:hypothetical protein
MKKIAIPIIIAPKTEKQTAIAMIPSFERPASIVSPII